MESCIKIVITGEGIYIFIAGTCSWHLYKCPVQKQACAFTFFILAVPIEIHPVFTSSRSFLIIYLSWQRLKKIAVILLLGVLLYNWFGYQLLYYYLQQHADQEMELLLDKNDYNENDLVEIRIPLRLPYLSDWGAYKRCDGEIELDGKIYKYVKRRVYNDSLQLLCLASATRQKLQEANNNYFRQANGLQSNGHHQPKSTVFYKNLLTDYQPAQYDWKSSHVIAGSHPLHPGSNARSQPGCTAGPEEPPEKLG